MSNALNIFMHSYFIYRAAIRKFNVFGNLRVTNKYRLAPLSSMASTNRGKLFY